MRIIPPNLCVAGFDPGVSGGLGFVFTADSRAISAEDIPTVDNEVDVATLAERLRIMKPDVAIVERVGAMPKQGVSSTFKFGVAYGSIRGVIGALGIPIYFVSPSVWKRHFKLGSDKEEARARALQLWPARAALFSRKRDHNKAEAALIARYAAETLNFPDLERSVKSTNASLVEIVREDAEESKE